MNGASPGVEKYGGNFGYVEGPVWAKQGYLLFSDIPGSRILKMTAPNHTEIYRRFTNGANGNSWMSRVVCIVARRTDGVRKNGEERHDHGSCAGFRRQTHQRSERCGCSRDGQVYFSDPNPKGGLEPFELGYAGVYHVAPDGTISLIRKMLYPNGVALTPDGKPCTLSIQRSETSSPMIG